MCPSNASVAVAHPVSIFNFNFILFHFSDVCVFSFACFYFIYRSKFCAVQRACVLKALEI